MPKILVTEENLEDIKGKIHLVDLPKRALRLLL